MTLIEHHIEEKGVHIKILPNEALPKSKAASKKLFDKYFRPKDERSDVI